MCRHVEVRIWGYVREMVCTVPCLHSVFPRFPSIHCTNLTPRAPLQPEKNQAIQWCAQVRKKCNGCKTVHSRPCWPPLPKEGMTQRRGQPANCFFKVILSFFGKASLRAFVAGHNTLGICLLVCYKTRADTAMSLRQARQKS